MTRFDEALPAALSSIHAFAGKAPDGLHMVRDMLGAVTIVWPDSAPLSSDRLAALRQMLHAKLDGWSAGPEQVLLRGSDLVDPNDVFASPDRRTVTVQRADGKDADEVVVVDRLMTNQEWLREPLPSIEGMKLCAAFSIKGGVGRTTAFAVWAWAMAREGKRVLVLDLDLEAPGIASVLSADLPSLGVTDWLVEALVHEPDDAFLDDCIQPWILNSELAGTVDILPAFGVQTQSYIEKLGRVFGMSFDPEHGYAGFSERLHKLLAAVARANKYDVVLIDSRAGLHDIGASVVTRLGAEVFMFARDETQSWLAYGQLFRHLRDSHAIQWKKQSDDSDMRWRMKMVAAQTDPEESARQTFIRHSYDCWLDLYDAAAEGTTGGAQNDEFGLFSFAEEDAAAPHHPLVIPFDPRIRSFRFASRESLPSWDLVSSSYGPFLDAANARLFSSTSSSRR